MIRIRIQEGWTRIVSDAATTLESERAMIGTCERLRPLHAGGAAQDYWRKAQGDASAERAPGIRNKSQNIKIAQESVAGTKVS
jgi:hypothetical protein